MTCQAVCRLTGHTPGGGGEGGLMAVLGGDIAFLYIGGSPGPSTQASGHEWDKCGTLTS